MGPLHSQVSQSQRCGSQRSYRLRQKSDGFQDGEIHREYHYRSASVLGRQRNAGGYGTARKSGHGQPKICAVSEDYGARLHQCLSGKAIGSGFARVCTGLY